MQFHAIQRNIEKFLEKFFLTRQNFLQSLYFIIRLKYLRFFTQQRIFFIRDSSW